MKKLILLVTLILSFGVFAQDTKKKSEKNDILIGAIETGGAIGYFASLEAAKNVTAAEKKAIGLIYDSFESNSKNLRAPKRVAGNVIKTTAKRTVMRKVRLVVDGVVILVGVDGLTRIFSDGHNSLYRTVANLFDSDRNKNSKDRLLFEDREDKKSAVVRN